MVSVKRKLSQARLDAFCEFVSCFPLSLSFPVFLFVSSFNLLEFIRFCEVDCIILIVETLLLLFPGLEINERPLKRALLDLGSLSISDCSTGKGTSYIQCSII